MKLKKLTAMLAVTAMLATTLFGCGKETVKESSESKTSEKKESVVASESKTEEVTEEKEFTYPMEGNPTVTIWQFLSVAVRKSFDCMEDTPYAKKLMENTGINVDWIHPSGDNSTEAFNLMLADQDYTDILTAKAAQVEQFYADEVIIQLNDVIDQYMPNFKAYLEANPEIAKLISSEDGIYYYVPMISEDPAMGNTYGLFARADWMEELNIEMPETMDEWHDALVKLKDAKGIAPLCAAPSQFAMSGAFMNAYVPDMNGGNYYAVEDGQVYFVPATDEYKEFLTVMNQWYDEGLINQDIASLDGTTIQAKMAADEAAVSWGYVGSGLQGISQKAQATNPDYELVAIPTAAKAAGAEVKYQSASPVLTVAQGGSCISTKCENVEAAARYLDYFWTEEGFKLANFGIEGESYNVVDGEEVYTDWVLHNPDGLTVSEAMAHYIVAFERFPGIQALNYLKGYYSAVPAAAAAPEIYSSKGEIDQTMRLVSHTLEESDELAVIQTELNTYTTECIAKFILGTMDVETQWDEYIENLSKYGIEDAIAIKQAAYERYVAK